MNEEEIGIQRIEQVGEAYHQEYLRFIEEVRQQQSEYNENV